MPEIEDKGTIGESLKNFYPPPVERLAAADQDLVIQIPLHGA